MSGKSTTGGLELFLCEKYGTSLTKIGCEKHKAKFPDRCLGCAGPVERANDIEILKPQMVVTQTAVKKKEIPEVSKPKDINREPRPIKVSNPVQVKKKNDNAIHTHKINFYERDADILSQLQERAEENRRSFNSELLHVLDIALAAETKGVIRL